MRTTQQKVQDSLLRVRDFLDTHRDVLGSISTSQASKDLAAALEAAGEHQISQGSAIRAGVGAMSRQRVLAKQLIDSHMKPISKFARGKLRGAPDYAELTVSVTAAYPARLLAAAQTMVKVASKYTDKFASGGLAPDTVDRLAAATEAFATSLGERSHAKGLRIVSTGAIQQALVKGRDAVRVLDAQVSQLLPSDDSLLAAWRTVSRVEAKTGKVRGREVTPAAPASATVQA